jgi:hypothetical protein
MRKGIKLNIKKINKKKVWDNSLFIEFYNT